MPACDANPNWITKGEGQGCGYQMQGSGSREGFGEAREGA
uniref:Uncharacterized protein n=1 Tax=Arundo donax TaxID=35708 RepID=A0A0A9B0B2_ARUDO